MIADLIDRLVWAARIQGRTDETGGYNDRALANIEVHRARADLGEELERFGVDATGWMQDEREPVEVTSGWGA